ncbi:hypothetical protein F5Y17DRAFT_391786 [Xylariaceae sp. FL0594]|nr:hypothetical protein F5Y17DRAFT_391786 [Xylariaceae sp. FL0594]
MSSLSRFQASWITAMQESSSNCSTDFPAYPRSDPYSLASTSHPRSFELGTGASIYTHSLLPAILQAREEVILVTCFWAPSSTLTALRDTLEQLARLRQDYCRSQEALSPLQIRICLSSRSFLQKLFHPCSREGYTYPPSKWVSQLGLPDPKILEAGLISLEVKSLFFLPFSVMHPKFLIIDRQRAWLPSCNVSWEPWLECCVELTGDAVSGLIRFYQGVWGQSQDVRKQLAVADDARRRLDRAADTHNVGLTSIQSPAHCFVPLRRGPVPTVILPSSHQRNPRFRPFPWQTQPCPPPTPLNCAILSLFDMAQNRIYLQTPNLTSAAVVDALLEALDRGVDVTVVTSKGMMVLEQLLTSGTTTSWCLRSFIKLYNNRQRRSAKPSTGSANHDSNAIFDLESQHPHLGSLEVFYFQPLPANQELKVPEGPIHSHVKLTMVDDKWVVLGSGNMDRASWFTSQELGILFQSKDFAADVSNAVSHALTGRLALLFSSKGDQVSSSRSAIGQ